MKYDITKPTTPALPKLEKRQNATKTLCKRVKSALKRPFPMLFPALCAQTCARKNQHFCYVWGFQP